MSDNDTALAIASQGAEIQRTDLFSFEVDDLSDGETLAAWAVLDAVTKKATTKQKECRNRLLEYAGDHGEKDDKGSSTAELIGGNVKKEARRRVKVDPYRVEALMVAKGLPLDRAGSLEFTPSEKKLESLVAAGAITTDELADCADVSTTYALKVKPPTFIKKALEAK